MTTIETITNKQISLLRSEAASAGDKKMVAVCDRALDGKKASVKKCVEVIRANEANG